MFYEFYEGVRLIVLPVAGQTVFTNSDKIAAPHSGLQKC